ncbi:MAG: MtnX-like HAD-IB family phosphatase [Firmicutes bacterium]|nr:MtnX-like HAD-IB family phosphatase [Bacillota bacterium]
MSAKYWVYTDYDGTVTLDDNQVKILDAFAPPGWREKEYAILEAGGKSLQYLPVIYADFACRDQGRIIQFIREEVRPDPCFPEFARYCRHVGLPLEILSDGMHFYIEDYLRRFGLEDLVYYSNVVRVDEEGFHFTHPHSNPECNKCGTCKKQKVVAKKAEGYKVIFIGDGLSDQCAAGEADLLFAKKKLAAYCRENGIPYIPYETFCQVLEYVRSEVKPDAAQ